MLTSVAIVLFIAQLFSPSFNILSSDYYFFASFFFFYVETVVCLGWIAEAFPLSKLQVELDFVVCVTLLMIKLIWKMAALCDFATIVNIQRWMWDFSAM